MKVELSRLELRIIRAVLGPIGTHDVALLLEESGYADEAEQVADDSADFTLYMKAGEHLRGGEE